MRIVTVFGATGSQGSSVLNAIMSDGTFKPRAISRNPESAASLALLARGIEVVKADLWDKTSIVEALQGSEAVFAVTNFWDPTIFPGNPRGEYEQGKNLVDAAKETGVQFFVWSSVCGATKLSNGKYTQVIHMDNKEAIEEYLRASGLRNATVQTGWFLENLCSPSFGLQKTSGGYNLAIPEYNPASSQAFTWVAHDVGATVVPLLKQYDDPEKDISGKVYPIVTARMTFPELVKILSKVLEKDVTFTRAPPSGVEELDDMYRFQSEIGLYTTVPVPNPDLVALGVRLGTVEEFIEKEKHRYI